MLADLAGIMVDKQTIMESVPFFISRLIEFLPTLESKGYIKFTLDRDIEPSEISNVFFQETGWMYWRIAKNLVPGENKELIEKNVIRMLEKDSTDSNEYYALVKNFLNR